MRLADLGKALEKFWHALEPAIPVVGTAIATAIAAGAIHGNPQEFSLWLAGAALTGVSYLKDRKSGAEEAKLRKAMLAALEAKEVGARLIEFENRVSEEPADAPIHFEQILYRWLQRRDAES